MEVVDNQIAYKKIVGSLKGQPVWEMSTKGGLVMVVLRKNQGLVVMGGASHRAVARFQAQTQEPSIVWDILEKSEGFPNLVLEYMAKEETNVLAALQEAASKIKF